MGWPAGGAGWGGPARGASSSRIKRGDPDGIRALRHDPERMTAKVQRSAELENTLYEVALHGATEMLRIAAASKLLDRLEGRSVARTVSTSADAAALKSLSDVELLQMV